MISFKARHEAPLGFAILMFQGKIFIIMKYIFWKIYFILKKSCFQNLFYQYPSLEAGRQAVCSVWACLRMLILQTGPPYCTLTSFPCLYFAFLGTMPPYLILKRPAPVILSPNLNLHLSSFCSNSNLQIFLQKKSQCFSAIG